VHGGSRFLHPADASGRRVALPVGGNFAQKEIGLKVLEPSRIGGTHPYTLDGFTVMASAFNGGSLFGKNDGIGEQGVGLTGDPSGQHEIFEVAPGVAQDYIQLDLSS